MSAKFLSDAAWYFYLFWLPKYLYDARGFDVKAVGHVCLDSLRRCRSWVPSGRLVFELPGEAPVLAERGSENWRWG